ETTLPFGLFVMQHEAFINGNFDTKFIDKYFKPEMLKHEVAHDEVAAIAAALFQKSSEPAVNAKAKQDENVLWVRKRKVNN
ncbi:MAG: biotin carboxylase, partial [Bacteroidota bacterium]